MLQTLLRASVEGSLLVALVWIVVRAVPGLSPSARAALWWCATAKFVVSLAWTVPVGIPVLPPPAALSLASLGAPESVAIASSPAGPTPTAGAVDAGFPVLRILLATWCGGLVVTFGILARRWRRTAGVIRRASPAPLHVRAAVAGLAARLALGRAPGVRISGDVATPLVVGFVRPALLLPARFLDLSPFRQQMALCHELMHLRRHDLWTGCVPALAERLFFFHPLVHLAAREYVFWRESACDAAVIETLDAPPAEYGRLLIDLGVVSPRTALAAAGASWSFSNSKRRIQMLGDLPRTSGTSRLVAAAAIALALAAAVPFRLVAREPVQSATRPPVFPAASVASPSIAQPPAAPARPAAAARQRPERPEAPETQELSYVLLPGGGDDRIQMSGSDADVERARSLRRGDEPLLWFRDRRGEFVVRDPSVLREVEAAWKPVAELGAKQGRLGAEQGALGSKMGELGAKQGVLGAEQGRLGAKQGALGAKQGELAAREVKASEAQRAEIEKAHRDLERDMRALEGEMKALDAKMREFEKPMRDLGAEMEALGSQMEALGRQMEKEAARARAELRSLLDRAVASGAAQPVK